MEILCKTVLVNCHFVLSFKKKKPQAQRFAFFFNHSYREVEGNNL